MQFMRRLCLLLSFAMALLGATSCSRHYAPSRGDATYGTSPQRSYAQVGRGELITIDAGHGGDDTRALGVMPHLQEKNLNLVTALMVRNHLEGMGYTVKMTRDNDVF